MLPGVGELLGSRPELQHLYAEMTQRAWQTGVDPVVLELCRLRIAQLHGNAAALAERTPAAVAAGLDEGVVAHLKDWPTDPAFDPAARAALGFAELFVMDVHSITDADAAAVTAVLGDAGMVGFVLALGVFDGATRLQLLLAAAAPTMEA